MWHKIKKMFHSIFGRVFRAAGYYTLEDVLLDASKTDTQIRELNEIISDQDYQLVGLVDSIGHLQRKLDDWNLLASCLVLLHGSDTITLKKEYLSEIFVNKYVTTLKLDENGGTILTAGIYEVPQEAEFLDDDFEADLEGEEEV